MTDDALIRFEGASSSATLDRRAQTLTFEHYGSVTTDEQKALSPLVIPLGAIASVECQPGRSTNWFWVVRRGHEPWRKGVWCDPCGVVSGDDPREFAERVRVAMSGVAPVVAAPDAEVRPSGRLGKLAKGLGRAMVDGFLNTR